MLRTSLGSISSNRRSYTSCTSYQRGLIYGAVASEITLYRIYKFYGIAEFTTRSIVFNVLICYVGDFKPRSSRPKKLIVRNKRHILRIVRQEPRITYQNLIAKSGVDVSHNTVYCLLKETNIIN